MWTFITIRYWAPAIRHMLTKRYCQKIKIGTMLPCNVIVQEKVAGQMEVSAVNPSASIQAVENEELADIAVEVKNRFRRVIEIL